jgi:hypothetical protein
MHCVLTGKISIQKIVLIIKTLLSGVDRSFLPSPSNPAKREASRCRVFEQFDFPAGKSEAKTNNSSARSHKELRPALN